MAEDVLFASDYDGPCPLCEEDEQRGYCRYRNTEQENEREKNSDEEEVEDKESQEFKRDAEVKLEKITEENWTAGQEHEDRKIETDTEENKTEDVTQKNEKGTEDDEETNKKVDNLETDEKYNKDEQESTLGFRNDETMTVDDDAEASDLLVPPLEDDCILQMGPDCTIDLVMVCDQSVERCLNEDLLLCSPKSSDLPQQPPVKSPPRPLSITLPPQNATVLPFQPQSLLQPHLPPQAQLEAPCLGKRPYGSRTDVPTGQLEVTLRQVYSTRRYTRFASRVAPLIPLASVDGETSSQALPSISTDAPLMPPKKKTRTFYSTDQLEELERVFQDDHYPDGDKRKEIAASIGVTPQRIMNRRAKWRKTAKATAKKPPASRGQPCVQVNRPPVFTAPAVTSRHVNPGNTLPPYSTIRTSCTSPPVPACVDMAPCVSRGFLEYMPPPMHSPPPIRRASLPLITAYNPPTHTVSLLLDTPEHSEPSSADTTPLSLQTDMGFDYDGLGTSVKLDYMTSAPQNSALNFQLNTFPQQTNNLLPQQTNTLLPQKSGCLMPQQSSTILPQYSHLSYLTPSPYLTPNPTESSSAAYLPLTTGTSNTLPAYTSSGHEYLQSQTGNQMLLQSGVHSFQAYPWTTEMYGQSGRYTQAVFGQQLSSQGHETQYSQLLPQQHYVQLEGVQPQPTLPKPTPEPLLSNVKVESEDMGLGQPIRVSEAEPNFHCDFSPINF
uniref:Homeobox domain-containing protein n=1 Tax=Cyprinus carpio carpio TaxID=630221 RepID=A0A9J7Z9X5_CYPCA